MSLMICHHFGTGHHQDQLNTRHTINVIVNNNKKERQKRYREQNRDRLKQREAERRERIQYLQSIAGPSTSSNTNRIELNNEEKITAQSSPGSEKIQPSSIQRNDQGNELNALQKKRERQQRYREQNRDKLKQREAERRKRLQNADVITELSTSPNIEFTEIINDPIIESIRMSVKPFSCTFCDKSFTTNKYCKKHEKKHTTVLVKEEDETMEYGNDQKDDGEVATQECEDMGVISVKSEDDLIEFHDDFHDRYVKEKDIEEPQY